MNYAPGTRKQFEAFLREHPEQTYFGGSAASCPLAKWYEQDWHYKQTTVNELEVWYYDGRRHFQTRTTRRWQQRYIRTFDTMAFGHEVGQQLALAALAEVQ